MASTVDSTGQISQNEPLPQALNIVCYDPRTPDEPCPICGGLGVIKYAVEPNDPRFGKFFRCPNHPIEVDHERHERLRRLSNLHAYEDKTFHNFEVDVVGYSEKEQQSLQHAYNSAINYAEQFDGWLLLEGTYGCGKTHLAAAVGNARLDKGEMALFITTPIC